jgi:7-cyano-7-deazaguanine synthase
MDLYKVNGDVVMIERISEPIKIVALASGGMDSTAMLAFMQQEGHTIQPVAFNYGSKHNDVEYKALLDICDELELPPPIRFDLCEIFNVFKSDLLQGGGEIPEGHYADASMSRTVVPGRNSIMLTIAAGFAESLGYQSVAIANHAGDHFIYPDCRPEFIEAINQTIKLSSEQRVSIYAPFRFIDKAEICFLGFARGAPLHLSWSCYKGTPPNHCGVCGTCCERHYAFLKADVPDPTVYENDPTTHFTAEEKKELGL